MKKATPFQSQSVPKVQLSQVLEQTQGASHSTWLEGKNNKTIAPESFPNGNPVLHKNALQAIRALPYGMCKTGKKIGLK